MRDINDFEIALLLEEYKIRQKESMESTTVFSNQTKLAGLYITVLYIAIPFIFNWINDNKNGFNIINEFKLGFIIFFLILPAIYTYLHAQVLVASCNCLFARYRMAAIEKKLNNLTGVNAPIWEGTIMPHFQSSHYIIKDGYFNPNWWLGLWAFILSALAQFLVIAVCMSLFNSKEVSDKVFPVIYAIYTIALLVIDSILHFYIWDENKEIAAIRKKMFKLSNVEDSTSSSPENEFN